MSEIDKDVLAALANNPHGLRRKEIFYLCETAAVEVDVSHALKRLLSVGSIVELASRHGNQGALYGLAIPVDKSGEVARQNESLPSSDGVAEDVLATDEDYLATTFPHMFDGSHLSQAEDDADSIDGDIDKIIKNLISLKKRFALVNVPDIEIKMQILSRLSAIAKDDIAAILDDISADLQGLKS